MPRLTLSAAAVIVGAVFLFLALFNPIRIFDIYVPDIGTPKSWAVAALGLLFEAFAIWTVVRDSPDD